ncbi:uncharacterized protein FA14DRAFT_161373 [Meira miltonrushii]|uniref:Mitochondrial carrier n=1 Tax=Meira miltonrushii TaxID=1280837 RepID=A0A316V7Y4_9BASI|nr:uncharacterized protein FA14DRAFT_161373 [Meira miltonrushii]PWN33610.1 hypothetical protein FA14DRAFT_161373 [Meira miltonrushii]
MLMGFFELILALFVLGLSVVISILISQPFTGALVRLRANYLPKAVSLDNVLEDGAQPGASGVRGVTAGAISGYFLRERQSAAKIGPVVSGIVAMLIRTRRLEGWPGIYKGSAPVAAQLIVLGFFTLLIFNVGGITGTGGGAYRSAPSGPDQFGFFGNLIFMIITSIVALPLNVITNRAIVHPRILSFQNARENLRELLSYSEFSQPWRLYLLPGLLPVQLMHIFWIGFVTRIVRHWTVPSLGGLPPSTPAGPNDDTYSGPSSSDGSMSVTTFGLAVFLSWCVLSVVILSPLECVMVRLSVQRPERQQPLHLAYARLSSNGAPAAGPAPYNNQAQVQQNSNANPEANQTGGYSDQANVNGKPDAQPTDPAPRPSFAIEDDDDNDEQPIGGVKEPASENKTTVEEARDESDPAPATDNTAHRVLGPQTNTQNPSTFVPSPSTNWHRAGSEPSEPVIALRPCDEPLSAEEAARAESEGFGAPTVERYSGMVDCLNKLVDEEGIEALYRGAWVTLLGILVGNFS